MAKDRRYITVRNLILGGYIKVFNDIFDTLPKSVVAKDLGFNNIRITKLMEDVGKFNVKDLFRLAALLEVPEIKVMELICNQHLATKKPARKK